MERVAAACSGQAANALTSAVAAATVSTLSRRPRSAASTRPTPASIATHAVTSGATRNGVATSQCSSLICTCGSGRTMADAAA